MKECFNIPELVIEICLQCDKHTLATLGRTARLFNCALDALWSGCHDEAGRMSLLHIIQFFTCEVWTRPQGDRSSLSSAIEPQHWNRFIFYARRIKAFYLDTGKIVPAFLALLVGYKPPGNILPNLNELWVYANIEDELVHAHQFLSPNLHTLAIHILQGESTAGSILASLFHTIPTISPNVSNLKMCVHSPVYFPALYTLHQHLRHLRRLVLHFITTEYLPLVTSLPGLTHLTIYDIADSQVVLPSTSTCEGDTLMFLHLSGSPKHIHVFFRLLSKCPLESVSLDICAIGDASEFAEIVRALTDKCQPHSLRRVQIAEYFGSTFEIPGEHLTPFLAFPNITHFEHHNFGPCRLDDSFISSLGTSWPNLDYLCLNPGHWLCHAEQLCTPKVTAKSFALLASHCPKLSGIGLEFDATTIVPAMSKDVDDYLDQQPDLFAIQGVRNRSVYALSVGYSPIAEPEPVYEFMRSLFPDLTSLDFDSPSFMESTAREMYTERWKSVRNGLKFESPA